MKRASTTDARAPRSAPSSGLAGWTALGTRALLLLALTLPGCEGCLKQVPVDSVAELPYPDCGRGALPEGEVLASGHLRSGPGSHEQVVEHYELRQRDCLYVMTVRQEWPLGIADVEAIYDEHWEPLRVWKRMTLPGEQEFEEIRRYELRTGEVELKARMPSGELVLRRIRGGRPHALVGPGRGLLIPWIRRTPLEVGEVSRLRTLDFRGLEKVSDVSLRRDEDRYEPSLGRTVRVYSVYGRESVFTDEEGVVIGDLAGLRPADSLDTEAPAPLLSPNPPDPVHTP